MEGWPCVRMCVGGALTEMGDRKDGCVLGCVCVGGALTDMGRQEGDNSFTLRRFAFSAWGSPSVPEFGRARQ